MTLCVSHDDDMTCHSCMGAQYLNSRIFSKAKHHIDIQSIVLFKKKVHDINLQIIFAFERYVQKDICLPEDFVLAQNYGIYLKSV